MELTELSVTKPLNIFYHDGFDNDRWFPFDRFADRGVFSATSAFF